MPRHRIALLCLLVAISTASGPRVESARPLPFFYDLYSFRGRDGGTAIVAAFAVPAGRLEREVHRGRVRYRFDVTLVLADTALRSVSRTDDSVFVDLARSLDGDNLLHTHIEVETQPSRTTLQRVIMSDATTPGVGQLYAASFPIPDYSGSRLMLSDIALGHPDAEGGWTRGDVTLALLPTRQFPTSAFEVYYEIYNLPAGNRYATEIAIEHTDPARADMFDERRVGLRFQGESTARADGTLPELRRVETSLPRGSYRITVTITDQTTGAAASRTRPFEVRGWERGVTMVPALPHRRTRSAARDR